MHCLTRVGSTPFWVQEAILTEIQIWAHTFKEKPYKWEFLYPRMQFNASVYSATLSYCATGGQEKGF